MNEQSFGTDEKPQEHADSVPGNAMGKKYQWENEKARRKKEPAQPPAPPHPEERHEKQEREEEQDRRGRNVVPGRIEIQDQAPRQQEVVTPSLAVSPVAPQLFFTAGRGTHGARLIHLQLFRKLAVQPTGGRGALAIDVEVRTVGIGHAELNLGGN